MDRRVVEAKLGYVLPVNTVEGTEMPKILLIFEKEDAETKAAEQALKECKCRVHKAHDVKQVKEKGNECDAVILLSSAIKLANGNKLISAIRHMHKAGKLVAAVGDAAKLFPVSGIMVAPGSHAVEQLCKAVVEVLEAK